MTDTVEYTYSANGEDGWVDDVESAVDDALARLGEDEKPATITIFRGEAQKHTHKDFSWCVGEDIQELLQERAYSDGSEFAEDYLADLSKEKIAELSNLVTEWLNANAAQPSFYHVNNIQPFEVKP